MKKFLFFIAAWVAFTMPCSFGVSSATGQTTTGKIAIPEAVDLGLSVKWATFNIGATSPEEAGDYYAWGETETKSSYDTTNSTWYGIDYTELQSRGIVWPWHLVREYDIATLKFGNGWRIPTVDDFYDLVSECTWTWGQYKGINGYTVTGKNGNSIFLPAAGFRENKNLHHRDNVGFYWSSKVISDGESFFDYLNCLFFNSDDFDLSEENTIYYGGSIRAVLDFQENERPFATNEISDSDAVDLGLGIKWAACNLGAERPEQYGDYYAWGETETKSEYTQKTSMLSYAELESQGIIDSNDNLTAKYDAATIQLGKGWRMPTCGEIYELVHKCTWTWGQYKGVNGYRVTGENGNSIFLPAAGSRIGNKLYLAGEHSAYWHASYSTGKDYLSFYSNYYDLFVTGNRYSGFSIRPVLDLYEAENKNVPVDLGLSVKWASCNIGAESPEQYGDYYAWGEIGTKSKYTPETNMWGGMSYDELKSQGIIDSNGNLTAKYDVATAKLGGKWRMPTEEEIQELIDNCTLTICVYKNVHGYMVTGKNGNSIFLPFSVFALGGITGRVVIYGMSITENNYWSSSASSSYDSFKDYKATALNIGKTKLSEDSRYCGLLVRPVWE